jgi:transglutaminase-like putative cysteine protease
VTNTVDPPAFPLDLSVRVGCEMIYRTEAATPLLALFKPRQSPTQMVREERMLFEPSLVTNEHEDEHHNIIYRTILKPGRNLLRHDAIVKVASVRADAFYRDGVIGVPDLPSEVLRYALPSRYADSDKLLDFAWQNFGHIPNGLARVRAICDWTHRNIEYRTGSGDSRLSASEIIARGFGVCRDMAHVGLALCRTFNLPARYVTGHIPDIAVEDPGTPGDFHAYFEVYLAHRWQTFDPRNAEPRIGHIKIGAGLDAANCAFSTIFGAASLERFEVWAYQVDPRQVSTADPVDLSKRLDATPTLRFAR